MAHHPAPAPVDNLDPHHEQAHAGHVIVRPSTLVAVLAVLLVFTVATVAASRAEIWAAQTFSITIPNIINVAVALSIAFVKAVLVAMFFMQLKYDNPLNTIIFMFCLFAFALFLFFSMTDLGSRGMVYAEKAGEIQRGGLGIDTTVKDDHGQVVRGIATGTKGIVEWARERRIEQIGELASMGKLELHGQTPEQVYWQQWEVFNHGRTPPGEHPVKIADAQHTNAVPDRPVTTPDLYTPDSARRQQGGAEGEH